MKISAVTDKPAPAGEGNERFRVEIQTDSDHSCSMSCEANVARKAVQIGRSLLPGEDPHATVRHWQRMQTAVASADPDLDAYRAIALLDILLWDLKSRALDEPLWRTLGGSRPNIPVCACVHESQLDDSEFPMPMSEDRKAGVFLALDPKTTPEQAIELLSRCESQTELICLLAPDHGWTGADLRQVSEHSGATVCATPWPPIAEELFLRVDHGDVDMLLIDPAFSGVTGSLQIADAAYGFELPVVLAMGPGDRGIDLASVMPNVVCVLKNIQPFGGEAGADP
jgi:L-alanine-DL-glutamate epimerase-like enolase superfamily enzyme